MKYYHLCRLIPIVWACVAFMTMACPSAAGAAIATAFIICNLEEKVTDGEDDSNADNDDDKNGLHGLLIGNEK